MHVRVFLDERIGALAGILESGLARGHGFRLPAASNLRPSHVVLVFFVMVVMIVMIVMIVSVHRLETTEA